MAKKKHSNSEGSKASRLLSGPDRAKQEKIFVKAICEMEEAESQSDMDGVTEEAVIALLNLNAEPIKKDLLLLILDLAMGVAKHARLRGELGAVLDFEIAQGNLVIKDGLIGRPASQL